MSKELIRLQDLVMEFDGERILDGINLTINDHEFLTLLGPSGCGKTTPLKTPSRIMTTAKNGSDTETMRSTLAPSAITSSSGVKMRMKNAGNKNRKRLSALIRITASRRSEAE